MGYRSNIAVAIKRQAYSKMMDSFNSKDLDLVKGLIDEAVVHKKKDGVLLLWDGIKWGTYFPEVAVMVNAIDNLEYDDYSYVEIGEDYSDATTKGGWYENPFNLGLIREIYYEE